MSPLAHLARRVFSPGLSLRAVPRLICTNLPATPRSIDDVNDLFAEARICLQDAVESKGTVYFADDFADAKEATQATLGAFDALLEAATAEERQALLEANRPKMAQLAEEFRQLENELIHDD